MWVLILMYSGSGLALLSRGPAGIAAQACGDFAVDVDEDIQLFFFRTGDNLNLPLENEIGKINDIAAQVIRAVAFGVLYRRVVKHHPDLPVVFKGLIDGLRRGTLPVFL